MANDSYQLVVRNAPQSGLTPGQVIALEDAALTLGRDPLSDIILDDAEVSRHHAKLTLQAGGYEIQDMGSTNGTFVDGKRLGGEPVALKPGQVIMLGSNVTLVYQAIAAVDPLATIVAPVAAAMPEEVVEEEPAAVEEIVEEVEVAVPVIEPDEVEVEVADEIVEEEEEFATMMDESPVAIPSLETPPEPELLPEIAPEPEPFPEIAPEPEPLPELPAEPEPFEEQPMVTFDDLEEPTFIDSAAPVSDFSESPLEPVAADLPPTPEFDEPQKKDNNNRNIIIVAVVVILLICCCLAVLAGVALFTDVLSSL